jgi:hypothetical protein
VPAHAAGNPGRGVRVAGHMSHPLLYNGYTPGLNSAIAARQWVRRRRELRMLEAVYPTLRRSLALDPAWRVHRVLSTVGDVTVALVGGRTPAAVLKCARSAQGTAALERSGAVVDALVADTRLTGMAHLLPRRLGATRTAAGPLAVLEELLPGEDGRASVTPATQAEVTAAVLRAISTLHRATASQATLDDAMLDRWVDEPIAALTRWYHAEAVSRAPALRRLRDELWCSLEGREVTVGWIHGDLAPGNVLLRPGTQEVSGLLDWERAAATGLPEIDFIHLHLTVQMVTRRRELGDLVCELLEERPGVTSDCATRDPALVLLSWLHHVSGIVTKSDRYRAGGLWAARNVSRVLACVEATKPRLPNPGRSESGGGAT